MLQHGVTGLVIGVGLEPVTRTMVIFPLHVHVLMGFRWLRTMLLRQSANVSK